MMDYNVSKFKTLCRDLHITNHYHLFTFGDEAIEKARGRIGWNISKRYGSGIFAVAYGKSTKTSSTLLRGLLQ